MLLMNMSGCCPVVMAHIHVNTDPSLNEDLNVERLQKADRSKVMTIDHMVLWT
jgi:hypothetical protein